MNISEMQKDLLKTARKNNVFWKITPYQIEMMLKIWIERWLHFWGISLTKLDDIFEDEWWYKYFSQYYWSKETSKIEDIEIKRAFNNLNDFLEKWYKTNIENHSEWDKRFIITRYWNNLSKEVGKIAVEYAKYLEDKNI